MRISPAVLVAPILMFVVALAAPAAQERKADQGVYTSAQATRGGPLFDERCTACHQPNGSAVILTGDWMGRKYGESTLDVAFTKIKTMPRGAPNSLTETQYLDVLAHLLKTNGFPEGSTELTASGLAAIQVPQTSLEFTLVQAVGCLTKRPDGAWVLNSGTNPVRARNSTPAEDQEAAALDAAPLGTNTYVLRQLYAPPAGWTNQRIATKGYYVTAGAEKRITVSSTKVLTSPCGS